MPSLPRKGAGNGATVTILGLGLMGASLGMALRAIGRHVIGYDAAMGVAERAHERGAVDATCDTVAEAVAPASLVVLAVPVLAMRELLAEAGAHLAADAVVTDLGSSKARVAAWAQRLLPEPGRFVGGHPMAGGERSGVQAAEAGLYRGCIWCLTPTLSTAPDAVARVAAMIDGLGARPHLLDPSRHDKAVALASHLPLVAASALVLTAAASPDGPDARILAARGWRDTTRVASGSPRMARDICLSNHEPLLAALDDYIAILRRLREQIASGDLALEETFARARDARDTWVAANPGQQVTGSGEA